MKINFTKAQYRVLLDMMFIADWVLHADEIEETPKTKSYRELDQMVLSFAEKFGYGDLVEWDDDFEKYFPTRKFEDESQAFEFIKEFENDTFWDELVTRLAVRDLVKEYGVDRLQEMDQEERIERQLALEEKYLAEFERNGLDNVHVGGVTLRR